MKFLRFTSVLIFMSLFLSCNQNTTELEIGTFSGSVWNVPNWQSFKFFDEAIDNYTNENSDIKISYRSGTLKEDYSEWLSQKILLGEEPDLFLILPEDFILFSSIGLLEDLNPLMESDSDFDREDYFSNALNSGIYEEGQFGFPLEVVPTLMFVNETLLDKKGISVPEDNWNWEGFYSISYDLSSFKSPQAEDQIQAVIGFDWKIAAYTNGQHLFTENGDQSLISENGIKEAVKFASTLEGLKREEPSLDFEDGNVAFTPMPFSEYRAYAFFPYSIQKYSNFDWEALLLPKGPHGNNGGELQSLLIGISARSKHKREAWEFLKFLVSDVETQKNIFHYSHGVPVLKEILHMEDVKIFLSRGRNLEISLLTAEQITESIENSLVFPRFEKYEEALELADNALDVIEINPSRLEHQLSVLDIEITDFLKH